MSAENTGKKREETIERIIALEWEDFRNVNNEGGKAVCQERPGTFALMRRAQFSPWPEELAESYLADLEEAKKQGRNLPAEKYAWMMESTAPEAFARIQSLLPAPSSEAKALAEEIIAPQVRWMKEYYEAYPDLSAGNRPLTTAEDRPDDTSFETYLRGELYTYSERTLRICLAFVKTLQARGENLALLTMEAIVRAYGYRSLTEAEEHQRRQRT